MLALPSEPCVTVPIATGGLVLKRLHVVMTFALSEQVRYNPISSKMTPFSAVSMFGKLAVYAVEKAVSCTEPLALDFKAVLCIVPSTRPWVPLGATRINIGVLASSAQV